MSSYRVAMVTLLPPSLSGIADYSAELLPHLASRLEVSAFYPDNAPQPLPIEGATLKPLSVLRGEKDTFDAVVVQLANDGSFKPMMDFASRNSSVAVLHDLNLSGIYGGAYLPEGRPMALLWEILRQEGLRAFARSVTDFALYRRCPSEESYQMNTAACRSARRIVVHSRAARDALVKRHGALPVDVVPHGVPARDATGREEQAAARRALRLPEDAFIIGSFGVLSRRKQIGLALEAFREFSQNGPKCLYCLVGPAGEEWKQLVGEMGLSDRVRVTDRVCKEDFYRYISAVDLCVNLRYPWLGEASGPLLRIMSCGKPAVVTDVGCFAEISDDACFKIGTGEAARSQLTSVFASAASDRSTLESTGRRGRDYVMREHSMHKAAEGYVSVVHRTCSGE